MSDKPKPAKPQPEPPVLMRIESVKSVGVENLADVEVHTINRIFGSISHYIKFYGGGEVRFSYNTEGKVLEFSVANAEAHIENGERILLKRMQGKSDTGA